MSRKHPNSLLLVDSIDRYVRNSVGVGNIPPPPPPVNDPQPQPPNLYTFKDVLFKTRFEDGAPPNFPGNYLLGQNSFPGNKFSIYANQPLIYGGIDTIALGQLQLYYAVPTITPLNSRFYIANITALQAGQPFSACWANIDIPYGFYTVVELCAMLEYQIGQSGIFPPNGAPTPEYPNGEPAFKVVPISQYPLNNGTLVSYEDIYWECKNPTTTVPIDWCFVNPADNGVVNSPWLNEQTLIYRTFYTLNIQRNNCGFPSHFIPPGGFPDPDTNASFFKFSGVFKLLYTDYIDILSNKLTKYQDVKDADTKPTRQTNQIARVYLCGQGSPQSTGLVNAPGSRPFYTVATLTNTKVIQWDPAEAVYDIDFELRDQYGDLLFWDNDFAATEFQLTLMCSE